MAQKKAGTVTVLCRQLGFSKQAYYKGLSEKCQTIRHKEIVRQQILSIKAVLPQVGGRKLHYLLEKNHLEQGKPKIGRDSLFDLLRQEDLLVKRKRRYVKTTDSRYWMRRFPNLIKELDINRPEQVWVADITYITLEKGFCFLHLVTDAYSKRVMGHHVSSDMNSTSTAKALKMAIAARQYSQSLIHHSDRGLQYQSKLYVEMLEKNGIKISTTQDSSPYDNAIAERINGVLKNEFGIENLANENLASRLVNESIQAYNQIRPHLSNHMLTPDQMHNQTQLKRKQWSKKVKEVFGPP